jgi:peptide/nickel transport system substrate-binding protein
MDKNHRPASFVILASLLIGSLVGCQPAASQPQADLKTATILIAEDPPSFNPLVTDTGYDYLAMEMVLLGLTDIDPNGNVFPELAAELPTVENGGVTVDEEAGSMSVTWKMRQGVLWSDGEPVTAKDAVFTYEAIANPETGTWMPGIDSIESVELVDDYTFVVNYSSIYPSYLTQFGGELIAIWPAHYCNAGQGFMVWDCNRQPLSSGPFVLSEWVEGDHLTFTKNEKYFGASDGKPHLDQVIVQIVPDENSRKQQMLNGNGDVDMWINQNTINDLEGSETVVASLSPTDRWNVRLWLNNAAKGTTDASATPHPILSNVEVRRAVRMAINTEVIIEEIFNGYPHPVWTEFFREPYNSCGIPQPVYDPEGAKAKLEEAGWVDADGDGVRECKNCGTAEDGTLMEIALQTYSGYGEPMELSLQLVGEQLSAIGFKVNLAVIEDSVLWGDYESGGIEQNGDFDIDMWDDGYFGTNPTDFIWEFYSEEAAQPGFGWNITRWVNPEFNALLDESYTLDAAKQKEVFCEMARILDEEVPSIPLFTIVNSDAYSARMLNVQSNVNDIITWNVADWDIK